MRRKRTWPPAAAPARADLIVATGMTQADGHAERRAALDMIHRPPFAGLDPHLTVGPDKDKGCDGRLSSGIGSVAQIL